MIVLVKRSATTRTIPKRTYKIIGPGRASTNLETSKNASRARQRRRYMMGTMNCITTAMKITQPTQTSAKNTIANTAGA